MFNAPITIRPDSRLPPRRDVSETAAIVAVPRVRAEQVGKQSASRGYGEDTEQQHGLPAQEAAPVQRRRRGGIIDIYV